MNYQDINAATIDRWIEEGWEWGKPISHEVFLQAKEGNTNFIPVCMILPLFSFVGHNMFYTNMFFL